MATNHKSRSEYTVGWMCALPKEQAAAIAMLDEEHPDFSDQPSSDKNTYTLGSIGSHNIVIACLPMGIYGTNSAATAANHMITTFPSIKIGLLVGIGGGIPPSVRLGDVVVSSPHGEFPGVVQWDFGKAEESGKFKRIGALNNPPRLLLTAVSKLRARHYLGGSQIPKYFQDMKTRWPSMDSSFTQCGSLKDPLLAPDNLHRGQNAWLIVLSVFCKIVLALIGFEIGGWPFATTGRSEETGGRASVDAGIDGDQGKGKDVAVHYGLIASGNMVIKDSERRDSLNKSLGGDVLCVEMEAAGMMNDFPCVVIRGICDYADSRKNDEWQNYAAAVAAGCAKELLGYVLPSDVDGERPAKDILGNVLDTVSKTGADVGDILAKLNRKEDIAVLNWLTPVDYNSQQSDFISRRQPKTGQWLLDSKMYQDWLNTSNQTLFCPGIPGAGKTILTSIVINDLVTKASKHGKTGVAYIYFNFQRKSEQTIENILRSLLKQLAQTLPSMPDDVKYLYDRETEKGIRPLLGEIIGALQSASAKYSRVFIILDALDECETSHGYLPTLQSQIIDLQARAQLNVFATSRHIPGIEERFKGCLVQEVLASEEDVRNYIDSHMVHLPKFVQKDQSLQHDIKDKLVRAVEGMFLLAQLYLDSLVDKTSVREMKTELESLQKRGREKEANEVLDQAYDQAMERIDSQKLGFKLIGRKVLSWITCAKRPLTTLELQHALAVKTGDNRLDRENLRDIELMVSACAGLVTVDEASGIIRLVHYTTQEYFEQRRGQLFTLEMTDIAITCITYLSFDDFQRGPTKEPEFEYRLQSFPLFDYAARNWGHHAREGYIEDGKLTLDFLCMDAKVSASFQVIAAYHYDSISRVFGPHVAVWFGLTKAVAALLSKGTNFNVQDSQGRTPLSWAAEGGHHMIVQQLLDTKCIEPGLKGESVPFTNQRVFMNEQNSSPSGFEPIVFWGDQLPNPERILFRAFINERFDATPLWYAARRGDARTVKLLLAEQVDLNFKESEYGTTSLWCAAGNGHEMVVKLLLNHDSVEPDCASRVGGMTPLSIASWRGHKGIVGMLLTQPHVDPDSVDHYGRTPLMNAAKKGYNEIFDLLLAGKRVNPNLKDADGWTPLLLASEGGHYAIAKSLLSIDKGNLNSVPSDRHEFPEYTSLQSATRNRHPELVETLHTDTRVDVDYRGPSYGRSALSLAVGEGHVNLVKLLLNNTANPNLSDNHGQTPLLHATAGRNKEIMKLLLAADNTDPNAKTKSGRTPLFLATEKGDVEAVQLLLSSKRVDLNSAEFSTKATPLLKATRSGHEAISKLLLDAGAEPDCEDNAGRTPLFYMATHKPTAILKSLIADIRVKRDSKDFYGMTPLSIAACHGHEHTVNLLLSTEAVDVESRDNFGRTPLWWATRNGYFSISKLLIQNSERKGISISTDLPPGGNSMSSVGTGAYCSICLRNILVGDALYQCKGPHDIYFALCGDCFEVGGRCSTTSHELFRDFGRVVSTVNGKSYGLS